MIDLAITWTVFYFFMWGANLPYRHGEAAFYLVSLALHNDVSSGSSITEGYVYHHIIYELWTYLPLGV